MLLSRLGPKVVSLTRYITFEYLREHARRGLRQDAALGERLAGAYLRPWQSFFSLDVLAHAMAFSPLIAVFISAIASETWRSLDPVQDLNFAAYFRSLTRRMYREATARVKGTSDLSIAEYHFDDGANAMRLLTLKAYWKLVRFDFYLARGDFAALYDRVRNHPIGAHAPSSDEIERICAAVDLACIWYWKRGFVLTTFGCHGRVC